MSDGLPRGLSVAFALLGLGAIVAGARDGIAPVAVAAAEHFDTAFVRANGFMMDSLRLGRDQAKAPRTQPPQRHAAPPTRPVARDTLARRDSIPLRYSPRGCMPE